MSDRGREGLSWSAAVFLHLPRCLSFPTHTRANTNFVFQHFSSIEGQTLASVSRLTVCNTKHLNVYALRRPFMSLSKCRDGSQRSKWWGSPAETLSHFHRRKPWTSVLWFVFFCELVFSTKGYHCTLVVSVLIICMRAAFPCSTSRLPLGDTHSLSSEGDTAFFE